MKRDIFAARMGYLMLKLTLFIIAVVTIFVTLLVIPPALKICVVLTITLPAGLLCIIADKSISQKRE